jgi:two-component system response regulator
MLEVSGKSDQAMSSPYVIVVVEDNPADVTLLRQALNEQSEPVTLQVLRDGEAALEFVRSHRRSGAPQPCLILLDLHLPKYDGATVLRAIRSEPELAGVDIVAVTTVASPKEQDEVMSLGVQAYRTKPVNWEEILQFARELMAICTRTRTACAP